MKILSQFLFVLFVTSIGTLTSDNILAQVIPPPTPLPNPIPENTEPIPIPIVNESNTDHDLMPVPVVPEDELSSINESNIEIDIDQFVWAQSITMIALIMGVIIAGAVIILYKRSYVIKK